MRPTRRQQAVLIILLAAIVAVPVLLFGWSLFRPVRIQVAGHGVFFGRTTPRNAARYIPPGSTTDFYFTDANGGMAQECYMISTW